MLIELKLSALSLLPILFASVMGRTTAVGADGRDGADGGAGDDDGDRDAESLRQAGATSADDDGAGSGADDEEDESVEAAGRKYLDSLTPEQRERPFDGEDDDTKRPAPAEAATDVGDEAEPIERESDGAIWDGESERWKLDGKFVAGPAPEGWVKPAPKPAAAAAPKKGKDAAAAATDAGKGKDGKGATTDEPKLVKVMLAGDKDRGEEDIEVEVDEEIAERIKRNRNGALRRQDYDQRLAKVQARDAELTAIEEELEHDPVGFAINKMTPERRLEVAKALLVEHFDELRADLEKYMEDDSERLREQVDLGKRMTASSKRLDTARQVRAFAQKCIDAAAALVPDDVDDDVREQFLVDARREFNAAVQDGKTVNPTTVKEILGRRLKLYGFDKPRAQPKAAARAAEKTERTERARPVTDRAREVADRAAPTRAEAAATQDRIRRVQRARAAGSRVAPAGAGAAPTQVPILKPEEETDVRTASKALRQRGLPETWTRPQ